MKKNLLLTLLIISAQLPMASAQEHVNAFFITTEMPDIVKFLPPPPDSLCPLYAYDVQRYAWGKLQRQNKWRADIAIRDAVYGLNTIISEFSEPFGLQISKDSTPVIYRLLEESLATTDSICTIPKRFYMRKRPFLVYHEPTLTPEFEASLSKNGSYPSGHAILGWSAALLLSEINPERADTLLSRGYMYGESRVIVGAHWQSDVDAGMLAASAAVSKLHTSPRFLCQMARAKQEFNRLSAKGSAASDDTTLEDEDEFPIQMHVIGHVLLSHEEWNTAMICLKKSYQMGHRESAFELGLCSYYCGEYEEAKGYFSETSDLFPKETAFHIGKCCYALKDYEGCIKHMNEFVEFDDTEPDAYRYLGMSYDKLHEDELAVQYFLKYAEGDSCGFAFAGCSYAKMNQFDKAVDCWQKGAESGENVSLYCLGLYYLFEDSEAKLREGFRLLLHAADSGNEDAMELISDLVF